MEKELKFDGSGYDVMTDAIRNLFDSFPGLERGEKFLFSSAPTGYGKAVFPTTGAVIQNERESITGHVVQECQYPLTVLFRASGLSPNNRAIAKEWLDMLGAWLEKQPIKVKNKEYVLNKYPEIKGTREIRNIFRQTPAYLSQLSEDKSEDWLISIVVQYRNEFDR